VVSQGGGVRQAEHLHGFLGREFTLEAEQLEHREEEADARSQRSQEVERLVVVPVYAVCIGSARVQPGDIVNVIKV
jgi:hypothetical protein